MVIVYGVVNNLYEKVIETTIFCDTRFSRINRENKSFDDLPFP